MLGSSLFGPGYYIALSAIEAASVENMEKQISSNNRKDNAAVVRTIQDLTQENVVRWTKNSDIIKKFCETNKDLQKTWTATLEAHYKKSPTQLVESLRDEKETHPVFHHYVAAYLLNSYISFEHILNPNQARPTAGLMKANVDNLLNESCNLGSYYALVRRAKRNCDNLALSDKPHHIELLFSDADRLAKLYGAIGYLRAGSIYLELSVYFDGLQEIDRSTHFFEEGVKSYLCAVMLKSQKYSEQLTNKLTNGRGLASTFSSAEGSIGLGNIFNDDVQAKMVLMQWLNKDIYEKVFGEAKREVDNILKKADPATSTVGRI
jgi:hypothetical protein